MGCSPLKNERRTPFFIKAAAAGEDHLLQRKFSLTGMHFGKISNYVIVRKRQYL
jgi:hypothetical protein